jgi:hypothetical protein
VTVMVDLGGGTIESHNADPRPLARWVKWTFHPRHLRRTATVWREVDLGSVRVEPRRWVRTRNASRSMLVRPGRQGPIWAVSMVKNEVDIIEETIRNLVAQGVDEVLVADNGSTDGTLEVLRALAADLPVHVTIDPVRPYWQGEKLSHLARAATRMGASWVVPFDADELWKGHDGQTVAEVLRASTADLVEATWWDYLPVEPAEGDSYAERFRYRSTAPRPQVKVAFRADWLARLWIGSHHVTVPRRVMVERSLRVAHYQFRTPEQMVRKARDGAEAARLAGEPPDTLPQWFHLAADTVADAEVRLQELLDSHSVVRDPATGW